MRRSSVILGSSLILILQLISPARGAFVLKIEPEHKSGYGASLFKTWIDADGNGCDTKAEVLIAEAIKKPKIGKKCVLTGGSWLSPYDNKSLTKASSLTVDHLVPLAEAWRSGAWKWSATQRESFANDLTNPDVLVAVSASASKSKADKDVANWLPTNGRCDYLRKWISIKARYGLSVDAKESVFIKSNIEQCSITGVILGNEPSAFIPDPTPTQSSGSTLYELPKPTSASIPTPTLGNYKIGPLLWSDEFDKPGELDSNYWTARYCGQLPENGGGTCHNNESQYFLPEAVKVDMSGAAVITANRITTPPANGTCNGSKCDFTSGRFDTQGKLSFQYGYIETRVKVPTGSGNWPAFWMLGDVITKTGWPSSGEVDIMEQWRHDPTRNSAATHYLDIKKGHRYDTGEIFDLEDLSNSFHNYGLAWFPDRLEFYLDGRLFFRERKSGTKTCDFTPVNSLEPDCASQAMDWPYSAPFFLIFNNAISDQSSNFNLWDGWSTSTMSIDYVRVFQIEGNGKVFGHK